jgi:DNA-binding HxlR family transcriptional regulator
MALLDLVGQRWTLRILWELQTGPETFRALQTRCDDLSPTVLNNRLKQLRAAGLVALQADGYAMTPEGRALGQHLLKLDTWARDWARRRAASPP